MTAKRHFSGSSQHGDPGVSHLLHRISSITKRRIPFLDCHKCISPVLEKENDNPRSYPTYYKQDPQSRCLQRSSPEAKKVEEIFKRILVAMYKNLKIEEKFSINGNEIKLSTSSNHDQGGLESNGIGCEFEYLKGKSWEVEVVDTKMKSASCGSKIFVTCEAASKPEAQLAFVIGHEIAHTVAGHWFEPGKFMLYYFYNLQIPDISKIFEACYKHWLRLNEFEADYMGLTLTALAGYDPHLSIEYFVAENYDKQDIFSTHPSSRQRKEFLSGHQIMQKIMKFYEEATGNYEDRNMK